MNTIETRQKPSQVLDRSTDNLRTGQVRKKLGGEQPKRRQNVAPRFPHPKFFVAFELRAPPPDCNFSLRDSIMDDIEVCELECPRNDYELTTLPGTAA